MDTKLTDLLMKTRKGATAGFGRTEWSLVLNALGFECSIEKERNTVVKYVVRSPTGQTLTIVKNPSYRHIVFYELTRWLSDIGCNLVKECSDRLGLATPDVEKAQKDLYERDLTNTGTCPVCEGNFKRESNGGLHHHGFQRPGDGMLHGSCFGVGYQPFELSSKGAEDYKDSLLKSLAFAKLKLEELPSRTSFVKMTRKDGVNRKGEVVTVTKESDAYGFDTMMKDEIRQTERLISALESDIVYFTKKVVGWKLDELPEVKHAGKFKVAS